MAKLEEAQSDTKPYIVVGADEAECREKLLKAEVAGEIDEVGVAILTMTGVPQRNE